MGWLSFGSKNDSSQSSIVNGSAVPSTGQILQRSHQKLTSSESDIETTLNQLKAKSTSPDIKVESVNGKIKSSSDINHTIADFINQYPVNNMFEIDGEKDRNESIICTSNDQGGKTCLKLKINSIELFRCMQKLEYFCSLPNDINATYFECRKIQ
ncbi:hypothetical protein KGF56_004714 [Candida oxycetoniae]|uniref:Uncharacterized protein n=1 Tax=Candida oxycetoniae TaxID=497107 RepID=A0AAI9ST29_9ASCO|nr:uncharacterized protein KGF56_004714 [Candida oxycetoniae]KAI3402473.2 hypothetical protein KGF56_004714 [Candida oxycetoniae]